MKLEEHETFWRFDPSKVVEWIRCERRYFFHYLMGWIPVQPALSLVFGHAIHLAMQYIYSFKPEQRTPEVVSGAFKEFEKYYNLFYDDAVMGDQNSPRNLAGAMRLLSNYMTYYRNDPNWNAIHLEVADSVPLTDEISMRFRIDMIVESEGKKFVVDHKTSGTKAQLYNDVLQGSTQMFCYLHAAKCFYGMNDIQKLVINKLILMKSGIEFVRIPFIKTLDQLQEWAGLTAARIKLIKNDTERVLSTDSSVPVLKSFPRRETGCIGFNRMCEYYDWCWSQSNPVGHECPAEFKVEFWDPSKGAEGGTE